MVINGWLKNKSIIVNNGDEQRFLVDTTPNR